MTNPAEFSGFTDTYEADQVQIRFALGTPQSASFDWTSFASEPCPTPIWPAQSTNEANAANGQAHVTQLDSATCGEVTRQFNNETPFIAYSEVLVDGVEVPHNSAGVGNPHQVVPNDVQYGGYNIIAPDYPGDPLTLVIRW